jgi:hypothetical protein
MSAMTINRIKLHGLDSSVERKLYHSLRRPTVPSSIFDYSSIVISVSISSVLLMDTDFPFNEPVVENQEYRRQLYAEDFLKRYLSHTIVMTISLFNPRVQLIYL